MRVPQPNFHHLQYFWAVAREGNLTRAAEDLRVAPSALSTQIRALEDQLGQPLFSREGRRLVLTEAGKLALSYADDIFAAGGELVSTLRAGRKRHHTLRVGAVATLSRNFQRSFIRPIIGSDKTRVVLSSGTFDELLTQLEGHELDVVLSNRPAPEPVRSRRLARQAASIVSPAPAPDFRFPEGLQDRPMVLPGISSDLRSEFDALCERLGVRVRVKMEVEDMAMLRLCARDSGCFALVPSVVVRDELREGRLHHLCVVPDIAESFFALTSNRRFEHPLVRELLSRDEEALLRAESADDAPSAPDLSPGAKNKAPRRAPARRR